MNLSSCSFCQNLHHKYSSCAIINVNAKPSLEYNSTQWIPSIVKALFIAEAPPFHTAKMSQMNDSYFYNPKESQKVIGAFSPLLGTLSWNLFWLLGIDYKLEKIAKLTQFRELSCFYCDAVKCRTERFDNKNLLKVTLKECSKFLKDEIKNLQPKLIVIMGERALFSVQQIEPFVNTIPSTNIIELMEKVQNKPLTIGIYQLLFIPLPIWKNRMYLPNILEIFQQVKKLI